MFYVLLESTLFEEDLYLTKMRLGADIFSREKNHVLIVDVTAGEFYANYSYLLLVILSLVK